MDTIQAIVAIVGAFIALLTFVQAVFEYSRQGAVKRVEHFLEMRKRLKDNPTFKEIADLTERDDIKLIEIPFKEKRDYLGLFEEIAIAMNSGLIRKEVAHYMFGYYVIRCWKSKYFWQDVNRESIYWVVFKDFAEQMIKIEQKFNYSRNKFRF